MRQKLLLTAFSILLLGYAAQAQQSSDSDNLDMQYHGVYQNPGLKPAGPYDIHEDDASGRQEWMKERFNGDLTPEFMQQVVTEGERQRALYPQQTAGVSSPGIATWRSIGPTKANIAQNGVTLTVTDSGRARTILPHPSDPNTVYFLTSGGGLWKTTNYGDNKPTWVPKSDAIGSMSGGAAAFGGTPDTIYLGTGDPFDVGVGGSVVKSTNGADTWSPSIKLGSATRIFDLKVDTSGADDLVLVGTNVGLFRSANSGATYTKPLGLSGKAVWSLAKTSAGWLAAVEEFGQYSGPGHIYLSADGGLTWALISNPGGVFSGAGRTTLAVAKPGDSVVYAFAAAQGDNSQLDLFRSGDGGQSWNAANLTSKTPSNPYNYQTNMNIMGGQAFYNHMLLVDPTDATRNTVYIGGNFSSARSTDGGGTWTLVGAWLGQNPLPYIHADHHAAAISTAGGKARLFFGTDGGIFSSDDGGKQWANNKNEGLVTHLIYAMASTPTSPDSTLIGLQDNGTRIRITSTSTFNQSFGGDGFGVAWSQANDLISMGSYVYSYIYRSVGTAGNTQRKWELAVNGINEVFDPSATYFVTPIHTPAKSADPTGLVFFTNTRQKVYMTTNGGGLWTPIGIAGQHGISPARFIRAVTHGVGISPVDTNHVGFAGTGGRIDITNDGGATWFERNLIAFIPAWGGGAGFNSNVAWANNNVVYASSEGTAAGSVRVAKSIDGGNHWAAAGSAATGLPDVPVSKLQVSPADPTGDTVYAATWLGVYRTIDGGSHWSLFGAGLPQVVVSDLYMPPDGSFLRVSTYGRGVWEVNP